MPFKLQLQGFNEVQDKLRKLGFNVWQKTEPVLSDGAAVLAGYVKQEASFSSLTGQMQRAVIVRAGTRASVPIVFMAIDLKRLSKRDKDGHPIPYPYFVEAGVAPHKIQAEDGGALYYRGSFIERVQHPGFRARKFFSRGVARGRYAAKKNMEAGLVRMMLGLGADSTSASG